MSKYLTSPLNETSALFSPQVLKCQSLSSAVVNRRGCSVTSVLTSSSIQLAPQTCFFFFF